MQTADFILVSDYRPAGDQPEAIRHLSAGLSAKERSQVLLGVTGSGKTYTMASVIEKCGKPAVILAPNKTLAAQLYAEMKSYFPHNAVEYFVSYYDYYQPEAYVPRSDTFIEKEASINEQIDRMRHAATRALIERRDVVIVASVSCIYGIGDVESYSQMTLEIAQGMTFDLTDLSRHLVDLQYKHAHSLVRGNYRISGDTVDIFPSHYEDRAWRLSLFGDEVDEISEVDPLTGEVFKRLDRIKVYANSHHVIPKPSMEQALKVIKEDLKARLKELEQNNKNLEALRLEKRTTFDIEMMQSTGICPGIENYSRYLTNRNPGDPPPTLFEYLPRDAVLFVDESHVAIPQLNGMYKGDASRKNTLSEYGFRLPACKDNRPLKFEEWDRMRPQTIFVSATPGPWELGQTDGTFIEQVIRPTGLLDPVCVVRPTQHQIDDLIHECKTVAADNGRVLVTTLTKKMAEALTEYLSEAGLKVSYVHSDIDTLERIEIIRDLRLGVTDVLVGINLLREGLDIPECALVAILDADKEGYLRTKTSLIQTIGRAARNVAGRAILYADKMTGAMQGAIDETNRRREKQQAFNAAHGITPQTIRKRIQEAIYQRPDTQNQEGKNLDDLSLETVRKMITEKRKAMLKAASDLEFEKAAELRDEVKKLEQRELDITR